MIKCQEIYESNNRSFQGGFKKFVRPYPYPVDMKNEIAHSLFTVITSINSQTAAELATHWAGAGGLDMKFLGVLNEKHGNSRGQLKKK